MENSRSSVGGRREAGRGRSRTCAMGVLDQHHLPRCSSLSFILCGQGQCWWYLPHRAVVRRKGTSVGDPALEVQSVYVFTLSVVLLGLCGLGPATRPVLAFISPCGKWTGQGNLHSSWCEDSQREPSWDQWPWGEGLTIAWAWESQDPQLALCRLVGGLGTGLGFFEPLSVSSSGRWG